MSHFDRIWIGLKAVVQLEGGLSRLAARVEQLDVRESETRERLVYLEGLIAGARAQASAGQPRLERRE